MSVFDNDVIPAKNIRSQCQNAATWARENESQEMAKEGAEFVGMGKYKIE